jgi:hypothetical protein
MEEISSLPSSHDGVTLDMQAQEIVEKNFGIYDHSPGTDPENPIPLVTPNPHYDFVKHHPKRHEVKKLLRLKAPKTLNMSIEEILNLDTITYQMYLEELKDYSKEVSSKEQDLLDDLDEMEN